MVKPAISVCDCGKSGCKPGFEAAWNKMCSIHLPFLAISCKNQFLCTNLHKSILFQLRCFEEKMQTINKLLQSKLKWLFLQKKDAQFISRTK